MASPAPSELQNFFTTDAAQLQRDLMERQRPLASWEVGGEQVRLIRGANSLWLIFCEDDRPFLALRAAYFGEYGYKASRPKAANNGDFAGSSLLGDYRISVEAEFRGLPSVRLRCWLKPQRALLNTGWPRDLFPVGEDNDPYCARGRVEAAQRGLNSGLIYARLDDPKRDLLYWQDFTPLAPYFNDSGTKPDGAVGGHWPELGFQLPQVEKRSDKEVRALRPGREYLVSDATLVLAGQKADGEQTMGQSFLRLVAHAYEALQKPKPEFRDWPRLAEQTLRDLETAPTARVEHYGFTYARPYNDAEYPDVMVQCTLSSAVADFACWKGEEVAFHKVASAGLRKFFDPKLKTLRRYLPNVGKDKDKDAVDSWYLYHPLLNLGHLARKDDRRAERLLLQSLDYGIKAARHFNYCWPIMYKVDSFEVIKQDRGDGSGQTDVGGLYAYVMLEAFELTNDKRYIDEARRAIDAAKGMRFELNYQANLTAWGAAACLRLWRISGEATHLKQSYVYLASFFHNNAMWESDIGHARHYHNFLGVTALHDAPYMAMFECVDSFAAFESFLRDTGPDVDQAAIQLVTQYCKFALDRAWFYFPQNLPEEALAQQDIRNGFIDRKLAFPVEDLYIDGQPAGQVGQEIYGAGAAFVFASRAFHRPEGVPFTLFCDHFLMSLERRSERSLELTPIGVERHPARLRIMPVPRRKLPELTVLGPDGPIDRCSSEEGRWVEYDVSAVGPTMLQW